MLGIFLDTETNGLNPFAHQIFEIAIVIRCLLSQETVASYESVIAHDRNTFLKSDPESLKINGFTWDEIKQGKPMEVVASEIITIFSNHKIRRGLAVFICQNPSFDRPFFNHLISTEMQEKQHWPYHWLDLASMYWARLPRPCKTKLSKDAIASSYQLPPEDKPHRAMNGTMHLIQCYDAVMSVKQP